MKLENQIVSLELAKKLKELGVSQDSLFYWIQYANGYGKGHMDYESNLHWEVRYDKNSLYNFSEKISAFTVAELGEMLPKECSSHKYSNKWVCGRYMNIQDWDSYEKFDTEADARAKLLCYLLEQKLLTL